MSHYLKPLIITLNPYTSAAAAPVVVTGGQQTPVSFLGDAQVDVHLGQQALVSGQLHRLPKRGTSGH